MTTASILEYVKDVKIMTFHPHHDYKTKKDIGETYSLGECQTRHRPLNVTDPNDMKGVETHAVPNSDVWLL